MGPFSNPETSKLGFAARLSHPARVNAPTSPRKQGEVKIPA